MPPVNKQQKTSKAGWTRKRSSPSIGAQYPSPAALAAQAKRIADAARESLAVRSHASHPGQPPIDPRSHASSSTANHGPIGPVARPVVALPAAQTTRPVDQLRPVKAQTGPPQKMEVDAPVPWSFPTRRILEENPYEVKDYQVEIVHYMIDMDNAALASVDSMDSQPEVQWFMRPFLLDFLVEVHAQFRLRPETLYLALNLIDRYVSKRVVYKKHYQLVGCAALWTAAKFEDQKDRVPLVKELSEMCCKAYDENAFVQMEGHVLGTVSWNLGAPSAEAWLRLFNKEAKEEQRTQDLARFLMEITLYFRDFVGLPAYDIATAAMILARCIANKLPRTDLLVGRTTIFGVESVPRVRQIVDALDTYLADFERNISDVLYRKYMSTPYSQASVVTKIWYQKGNRYVAPPARPYDLYTYGSGSRGDRRYSAMSSSPSGGQSSSSSENGDEPLTPNTPVHMHNIDPFSAAAKENVAPTPTRVKGGVVPTTMGQLPPHPSQKVASHTAVATKYYDMQQQQAARPVLTALPPKGDLTVPRTGLPLDRRLSN